MASKTENIVADLSEIDLPDTTASARELFDLDIDMEGPGLHEENRARARFRRHVLLRSRHHARDPGGLCP